MTFSQEYVCVDRTRFESALSVFLGTHDITETHLFLGYKPLIIGIAIPKSGALSEPLATQTYIDLKFRFNEIEEAIAGLTLTKVSSMAIGDYNFFLFEGVKGHHLFLSHFYQWINDFKQRFKFNKPGNINLPGNLYDQVRIAYSIPRTISVITVGDGSMINLFPTDLHGPVGERFYISSLRINGKANEQVGRYKNILISEVNPERSMQVYELGKNHMKELRNSSEFELAGEKSETFGLPLPAGAIRYRELRQIHFVDCGIHRIHVYEIINFRDANEEGSVLAHIHQYYAQWRMNQRIPDHFFNR